MEQLNKPEQFDKIVTIAVDVQNDFCPGGALAVKDGDRVVDPLNRLFSLTRQRNGLVIVTRDQHPTQTDHFKKWPVHCVTGTYGAEFHKDLNIDPDGLDVVINKGTSRLDNGYSAFEGETKDNTPLNIFLDQYNQIRVALLIGGLATEYCVEETVVDALRYSNRGMPLDIGKVAVYLVTDAVRGVNLSPNDDQESLKRMASWGANLVTSDEVLYGQVIKL